MNDDMSDGFLYGCIAILLLVFVLCVGAVLGRSSIVNDCNKIGAFTSHGDVYTCKLKLVDQP